MSTRTLTIPGSTNLILNGKMVTTMQADTSYPPVVQSAVPLLTNLMEARGDAGEFGPSSGNSTFRGLPDSWATAWGTGFLYGEVCSDFTKSAPPSGCIDGMRSLCLKITPNDDVTHFALTTNVIFWTGEPVRLKFKYKFTDLDGNPKTIAKNIAHYDDGVTVYMLPSYYDTEPSKWIENLSMLIYAHPALYGWPGGPEPLETNDTRILLSNDVNPELGDGWRQYTSGHALKIQGPSAEELAMPVLPLWYNMSSTSSWRNEPDCKKWARTNINFSFKNVGEGYLYISDVELRQERTDPIPIDDILTDAYPYAKENAIYFYGLPDFKVGSGEDATQNPNQPPPRSVKQGWKPLPSLNQYTQYIYTHPYELNHTGWLRFLSYTGTREGANCPLLDELSGKDPLNWWMFGTYPHYMDANIHVPGAPPIVPSTNAQYNLYDQRINEAKDGLPTTGTWTPTALCPNHVGLHWWSDSEDALIYDRLMGGLVKRGTPCWQSYYDFPFSAANAAENRFVNMDPGNVLLNDYIQTRTQHWFDCNPGIDNLWIDTGAAHLYMEGTPVLVYGTMSDIQTSSNYTRFYLGSHASSTINYYVGMTIGICSNTGIELGTVATYNSTTKYVTVNKTFSTPLVNNTTHYFIVKFYSNILVPRSYDGTVIINDGNSFDYAGSDHRHNVNQINRSARDLNPVSTDWDDPNLTIRTKVRNNARANPANYQWRRRIWKSIREIANLCHANGVRLTMNMAGTTVIQGNSYAEDPMLNYPFTEGKVSVSSGTMPACSSFNYFGSVKAAKGFGGKWLLDCLDGILHELAFAPTPYYGSSEEWEDQVKAANCKAYGGKYLEVLYGLWTSWKSNLSTNDDGLYEEILPIVVEGKTYYTSLSKYWINSVWAEATTYSSNPTSFVSTSFTPEEIANNIPYEVGYALKVLIRDYRFAYVYGSVLMAASYRKKNVQYQTSLGDGESEYHYPVENMEIGVPLVNWFWVYHIREPVPGNPYRAQSVGGLAKASYSKGFVLINVNSRVHKNTYSYTTTKKCIDTVTGVTYLPGSSITLKNARAAILKYI